MSVADHDLSPNPCIDDAVARQLLRHRWGLSGTLTDIGSLEEQNLRLDCGDGRSFVLKVADAKLPRAELELQNAAMSRVAAALDDVAIPTAVPTLEGDHLVEHDEHWVRLLTWVDGSTLDEQPWLYRADRVAIGRLAARVAGALDGLENAAVDRPIVWDPRRAGQVVDAMEGQIADPELRRIVAAALQDVRALRPAEGLPLRVIHADVTPSNVTGHPAADSSGGVSGVIDFGDVMRTWRVCDVACSALGVVEHPASRGDLLGAAMSVLEGYHGLTHLTEDEAEAFWPLLLARAAANAAITDVQGRSNPDNAYAVGAAHTGREALEVLLAVPRTVATAAARIATGHRPAPLVGPAVTAATATTAELVPGLRGSRLRVVDLSVDSDLFSAGEWLERDGLAPLLATSAPTIGRWGESRIVGCDQLSETPPDNLHLGVDVFVATGTEVRAPIAASVHLAEPRELILRLRSRDETGLFLRLSGLLGQAALSPGATVVPGEVLGRVAAPAAAAVLPPHLHVQLQTTPDLPSSGSSSHREAWLAVCPDPSALLGVEAAAPPPPSAREQRRLREGVVASPQHLYYAEPVEIVRGWRHFLYDAYGRCYLDMINNIATVGHSHPRVTHAATEQLRRLNTNSRFMYESMTQYCGRIADLLPAGLDRVFLVNSGSEAADLALQLARASTGRPGIIAIAGAYHGWTGTAIDVCSSPHDHPNWREVLPRHTHIVEQPDPFRGAHGADVDGYLADVHRACGDAKEGGGLAGFVSEPLLGNQGAVEPVDGYLRLAYDAVRRAGGLCIADEVQVGMARTGDFWAFEHEGVVPDIVYTAKATGNGHPLGVVACSREIADAFDARTAFFASTGGGPVSCAIGLAVLDVIRDEQLQENARRVGGALKSSLQELAVRHPLIGAVHGRGLYLGVDLVRDRVSREPATEEAYQISEQLRHRGVIMQPTGDALNVLKVKPPLCLDRDAAEFFVETLDQLLRRYG
ncbi:MAG: aminotransferase [Nocardioidaceae bacterium]